MYRSFCGFPAESFNASTLHSVRRKSSQIRTDGQPSLKASISALWGPKQLESLAELNLRLSVVPEKQTLKRQRLTEDDIAYVFLNPHATLY